MYLCLDIGGSNIRIAFVENKKIKNKNKLTTPKTKEKFLKTLSKLIESYLKIKKPKAICLGIAVLQKNGFIVRAPHLPISNINIKNLLNKKFSFPVYVANDAKCACLAELYYGAGKNKKNFVLLTLGTGIGAAIVANGKLFNGQGIGSEAGHMFLQISPELKEFEQLASGNASLEIAKKYGFHNIPTFELQEKAKNKDKNALAVYKEIGKNLGIGLVNIANILDPELIILGGGFSKVPYYWQTAIKTFHELDLAKRNIPVVKAKLGDDAGLIGAGILPKMRNI